MKTSTLNIKADYLSGADTLRPFYNYPVQSLDFREVIKDKSADNINRSLLKEVLKDQYEGFSPSPLTQKNLKLLDQDTTYTVTTGHQLVLFGGPLYTSYKVLSAIRLAEKLSNEIAEVNVVPVFWIHTEDHDFDEINHFYTDFQSKHTYGGTFSSQVGNHILEKGISAVIPEHLPEKLKQTYEAGITMKLAYRRFMFELFDKYGVLILDASDARLKTRFRDVLRTELSQSRSFTEINRTSSMLAAQGYPLQINSREINLFYMDDQGRDRILSENGHYEVLNRDLTFKPSEMEELINKHPEKFSPNVSLRPLYQEMILPNLAYYGGWGEVAYWLQLKGVFEAFKVNFPCVLPRMSATVFTAEQANKWESLGFSMKDIQRPLHELYQEQVGRVWDSTVFEKLQVEILENIDKYKKEIENNLSTTLARSVEALKVKNENYLSNMRKKAERVIRHKFPDSFQEIETMKSSIQPDGWVQERTLSLAALKNDLNPAEFVDFVYKKCNPLDFQHQFWILP